MAKKLNLIRQKCVPCEGGTLPLPANEIEVYLHGLPNWHLAEGGMAIQAEHLMKDFVSAVKQIRKIARLAEKEGHHPDLHLTGYRHLSIVLSTHAIGGLSVNDFILAAKIDRLFV